MIERQELYCHNCDRYVQFNLDLSVDGNYRLDCPFCGHDHYRVVKDRKITDERYGQSPNQNMYTQIYTSSSTTTSTWTNYGGAGYFSTVRG
jgi:hypothetical protein